MDNKIIHFLKIKYHINFLLFLVAIIKFNNILVKLKHGSFNVFYPCNEYNKI